MFNRENAIDKVKSFATELLFNGIKLDKVILFVSYSVNRQNENSDIDVVLVSEMFSRFGFEDRKLFSKVNIKKNLLTLRQERTLKFISKKAIHLLKKLKEPELRYYD